MRVVPIPSEIPGQRLSLLPPQDWDSKDCQEIEVIIEEAELPSGATVRVVSALVFASQDELERIAAAGGRFWFRVVGNIFPPVMFEAPALVTPEVDTTKPTEEPDQQPDPEDPSQC